MSISVYEGVQSQFKLLKNLPYHCKKLKNISIYFDFRQYMVIWSASIALLVQYQYEFLFNTVIANNCVKETKMQAIKKKSTIR